MKVKIFFFFLFLTNYAIFSQSFEGTITYKVISINPYSQISDSVWHERLKEYYSPKGYSFKKKFFKGNKYKSEMDFHQTIINQVYNSRDGLIYDWIEKSDTVYTINSKISRDELFEIIDLNKTEKIMDIECKAILIKTRQKILTYWYNPMYFKIDPTLYKGHFYGSFEQILRKVGCLPLRIEYTGEIGKVIETIVGYNQTIVDEEKFKIPNFEYIFESEENDYFRKN